MRETAKKKNNKEIKNHKVVKLKCTGRQKN
jgi:hypothetical protein